MNSPADFWWTTLSSPLSIACAVGLALFIILAILGVRAMVRLGKPTHAAAPIWRDQGGTATIEFALLLPILLFVVLMLAQLTLLMGGNVFIHYAAFAAVRAAVVQIPTEYLDCPGNMYVGSAGSTKRDAIHRAAALALVPVSGRGPGAGTSTNDTINPTAYADAIREFYSSYGTPAPPWIDAFIADRVTYAAANTEVMVMRPRVIDPATVEFEEITDGAIEPKDPIMVRVEHNLNLGVPYVNRIFSEGKTSTNGHYMVVRAASTLTNEGILDQFPEEPELPRIP